MIKEAIDRILQLAMPHFHEVGKLEYSDKNLSLITPPAPALVECSTLQGLVDLFLADLDNVKPEDVLVQITSPTSVDLISKDSDDFGRRRVWVRCRYPETKGFSFGAWLDPESFIIQAQQHFQRVKIENGDGSMAADLDYMLGIASKISADHTSENVDDGFTQRIAVKQGVSLKAETILKPVVNLAPYRTFAEIDQVISAFVFRARIDNGTVKLALFEGDGGRWKIAAAASILAWLEPKFASVPVIS